MTTILIVEDDVAIAQLLVDILEDAGYTTRPAFNGRLAVAALEQALPDLILSDMMMPIMDGRELCRILQTTVRYQSIPLVLMSAVTMSLDGCTPAAVLAKPFRVATLLALVERLLRPAEQDSQELDETRS